MKDKTQKSFKGIARTLLLVFCYAFGSHAFALALEHEQTVEIYKVTDVPNPRNESSSNWVSNPNQILDESYVWEINNMLSQLEDSLSIEVAVVALSSIGEDIPAEFAHKLFEHWGIGKKADDNGLLILLVLDQRKVTLFHFAQTFYIFLQNKHDFVTDNPKIVLFRLKKCCLVLLFVIEMLYLCKQ